MAKKAPSFQFYVKDFLSDENQVVMTNEECGAYTRLMCFEWNERGLPTDPAKLARMVGETPQRFAKIWPAIKPCFQERETERGARYVHPRLEIERENQRRNKEARKGAADHRWELERKQKRDARAVQETCKQDANASDLDMQSDALHLQSAIAVPPIVPPRGHLARGGFRRHPLEERPDVSLDAVSTERAERVLAAFAAQHRKVVGSSYVENYERDWPHALRLVKTYSDREFDALLGIYLIARGEHFDRKPRTLGRLAEAAAMIEAQMRKEGQWPTAA